MRRTVHRTHEGVHTSITQTPLNISFIMPPTLNFPIFNFRLFSPLRCVAYAKVHVFFMRVTAVRVC